MQSDWRVALLLETLSRSAILSLTIERVSSQLRLSPRHAAVIFKKHIGVSFRSYVRQKRLERAKDLLAQPELSVKEIASNVGYSATSNFDRDFRVAYGQRPRDYRESLGFLRGVRKAVSTKA